MTRHDFTDDGGTSAELAVYTSSDHPEFVAIRTTDPVRFAPRTLPRFIAALYAAAGKPEPLILDRPDIKGGGAVSTNIFTVAREPGFGGISVRYHGAPAAAILGPGPARVLASVIAAFADEAEALNEPDPAEIQALALVLSDGTSPTDEDRMNARTVLRAGYKREGKP